ncbi:MAG: hypothetical protein QME12_07485 [Nanoarchaeota archaeon]|nr:hypothetical protein [Nanoarchaeota archaeon]
MIGVYSKRELWGLPRVYKETIKFDKIISDVFAEAKAPEGEPPMAIFAYGSPGRFEFTGGDSDADIFIAEPSISVAGDRFKKTLKQRWGAFDFSKVDIPPCSTYDEIDTFLNCSLVEGNQILETRFICGDEIIRRNVEERKKRFDSPYRELTNIIFNRLYFDQYFKQRVRDGARNIKYCNGGTRDFLVFYWYDRLCKKIDGKDTSLSLLTQPQIKEGLERLMMEGSITGEQFGKTIEAVNGLIELRTDALIANRTTEDRGLSILDGNLIRRLQRTFGYPDRDKIKGFFDYVTAVIDDSVKAAWKRTLEIGSSFYGQGWGENIELARAKDTPQGIRMQIPDNGAPTRIALLWGTTNSGDKDGFEMLTKRYKETVEWGTLASIVCSPLCSPEVLHDIGTGIAKEKGYGYILRVVGRNKNTSKETLKNIADDSKLDERYSGVAKTALELGSKGANNLI